MIIKQILVVKETRESESRVALVPRDVASLTAQNHRVLIESEAGLKAGFPDQNYIKVGAEIFSLTADGFPSDTLILRVKRANEMREHLENQLFRENTFMMGFLDTFEPEGHIFAWQKAGITTFSLGVFRSLSVNDPRNAQAAMSCIAGRLAFQDALMRYKEEKPIKLTVLGSGPAAFSAAFEARRHGVPVQLFGRQEKYRSYLEMAGIKYYVFSPKQDQARFIQPYLKDQTIVIAAARTPRVKAPLLIDEQNLRVLPKGAIAVDLAISEGGNIVGTRKDDMVTSNGVSIVNISGYPKATPTEASEVYSKCLISLLADVLSPIGEILLEHELLTECCVTHLGKLNPLVFGEFEPRF